VPHRFDVDQAESFAAAWQREASTPSEKLVLLLVGDLPPETHATVEVCFSRQALQVGAQVACPNDPQLSIGNALPHTWPGREQLAMSFGILLSP
jgi:hypothetical protein